MKILKSMGLLVAVFFASNANASSRLVMEINDLERDYSEQKYETVKLVDGLTHFQDVGSRSAPAIILVHGVSGPLQVWDKIVDGLQNAGYRVIRYDLYGRGFSERLAGPYELDLYVRQLQQLATHLGLKRFRVTGSSMGAIIASQFANSYPDLVEQVALIGPAGFPIEVPLLARMRDFPVLGSSISYFLGNSIIFEQNRKYFVHPELHSEFLTFFRTQLEVNGTSNAILSTMRNVPVTNFESGYRSLAVTSKPIAVIWGREDVTFPYQHYFLLKKWIPAAQMLTIDDAAHLPQYEQPEKVLEALLKFFNGNINWTDNFELNQKGDISHSIGIGLLDNGPQFDSEFFKRFEGISSQASMDVGSGVAKTYEFPTRYRGVTFASAMFLADYDKVVANIHDESLHPIYLGFNRTLLVISSYRYGQVKGMPPYNEVAISIPVKPRRKDQPHGDFISKILNYEMRILRMPVTSQENLQRGRYFWGIYKTLEGIELSEEKGLYTTRVLNSQGQLHFTWQIPVEGQRKDASQRIVVALSYQSALSAISEVKGQVFSNMFPNDAVLTTEDTDFGRWLNGLVAFKRPILTQFGIGMSSVFGLPGQIGNHEPN